ncbi:J domain-containing protein [Pararhizobium haloflavum]|uniref:J domain-containing protein n=1 Tax=Pararhizobium haloflavum TaxID=2037914 RepID=UPI001FE0F629|nr:J domain-containing protein [Pararhizobium haloflavum]
MPRAKAREKGQFRTTLAGALKNVEGSLASFARDSGKKIEGLVISSNVTLGVNRPDDPGVALWFTWDGLQVCIPVDRYSSVEANLQAIHHVIEARRTELRHGTLALVRATFQGFQALPAPAGLRKRSWRDVMDFGPKSLVTTGDVESRFKALSKQRHPDMPGGSDVAMSELNSAKVEALREIGGGNG